MDGGFAEYAKVRRRCLENGILAKSARKFAAVQEPFGNAVHAASQSDLKGKTVRDLAWGQIGMFLTLIVQKVWGRRRFIGIEPNPVAAEMVREAGN